MRLLKKQGSYGSVLVGVRASVSNRWSWQGWVRIYKLGESLEESVVLSGTHESMWSFWEISLSYLGANGLNELNQLNGLSLDHLCWVVQFCTIFLFASHGEVHVAVCGFSSPPRPQPSCHPAISREMGPL